MSGVVLIIMFPLALLGVLLALDSLDNALRGHEKHKSALGAADQPVARGVVPPGR